MKINRNYINIACLLMIGFNLHPKQSISGAYHFDIMTNFSYPISDIELIRHEITQGLYFLQQSTYRSQNSTQALQLLELAQNATRLNMTPDDEAFFQAMIDQINALINNLENKEDEL